MQKQSEQNEYKMSLRRPVAVDRVVCVGRLFSNHLAAVANVEGKAGNVSEGKEAKRRARVAERAAIPLAILNVSNSAHLSFGIFLPFMEESDVLDVIVQMSLEIEAENASGRFALRRRGSDAYSPNEVRFDTFESAVERREKLNNFIPLISTNPLISPNTKMFYLRFNRETVDSLAPEGANGTQLINTINAHFPLFARVALDALSTALDAVTGATFRIDGTVFPSIDLDDGMPPMPIDGSRIEFIRV